MVTIVKHEWHQHDRQYAVEIDEALLSEIYPDLDEDEIAGKLSDLENGEITVDDIVNDAYDNDVELEWDFQYDDCWTDRKGGYEITYEMGDEDSWHTEPEPAPHTHKCTKCKWTGQSYDGEWKWQDENGNELDESIHVCPYCESHTELTEAGIQEEKESAERQARWDQEAEEDPVDEEELARALEELKQEFEALTNHTHYCTECDWTGNDIDHEKEGICPKCCAYTEKY